jgi:hypothetical protein
MNGTITMPDGTELPLSAISLSTSKGQVTGTCRITPTVGVYVRQHAREEGQLKLADGRQAKVRVGGARPSNTGGNQEPLDVFHFQLVEGWD